MIAFAPTTPNTMIDSNLGVALETESRALCFSRGCDLLSASHRMRQRNVCIFTGTCSPSRLTAGSSDFSLTLTGTNFTKTTQVFFGTLPLIPSSITTSQLVATVPASAVAKAGVLNVAGSVNKMLLRSDAFTMDISGSGFLQGMTIKLGELVLVPTSIPSSQVPINQRKRCWTVPHRDGAAISAGEQSPA
jgi:hypothetical protein